MNKNTKTKPPPKGPSSTLLTNDEIDALYETFEAVVSALASLHIPYIITGGTLLGAIRQHSILFCDDDIDIAIIETDDHDPHHNEILLRDQLSNHLDKQLYQYQIKAWEGGDKVRHKRMNNIFVDIFVIRSYNTPQDLVDILSRKKNGTLQSISYISNIVNTMMLSIQPSISSDLNISADTPIATYHFMEDSITSYIIDMIPSYRHMFPIYHFHNRKAMEMWPKEVYRYDELFPIQTNYKFGPYDTICGPHTPLTLLYRAFGTDCLEVYYQSKRHDNTTKTKKHQNMNQHMDSNNGNNNNDRKNDKDLLPLLSAGGQWEDGIKTMLCPEHYIPIQPTLRKLRRYTLHCKETLFDYIEQQTLYEEKFIIKQPQQQQQSTILSRPQQQSTRPPSQQQSTLPNIVIVDAGHPNEQLEQQESPQQQKEIQQNQKQQFNQMEQNDLPVPEAAACNDLIHPQCTKFPKQQQEQQNERPHRTVYMDGVFDMFHIGHLRAIQQCVPLGDRIIIGVTGDYDASQYKRYPIVNEKQRTEIVANIQHVDLVICPCPLIVTEQFLQQYQIDLVVHGFINDHDYNKQYNFFQVPIQLHKFQRIQYSNEISTTEIIHKIKQLSDDPTTTTTTTTTNEELTDISKKKWFGHAIEQVTNRSIEIPYDPIPITLRVAIEPHIEKARINRSNALNSIRDTIGAKTFHNMMNQFCTKNSSIEDDFYFDTKAYEILPAFLKCTGCGDELLDLSQIHSLSSHTHISYKHQMMYTLTHRVMEFQNVYDHYICHVIAPQMEKIMKMSQSNMDHEDCYEIYYQSFPCIRIIEPNEFSIGPHADIVYGHHPCSINFYVPLTSIYGSSSLFLESKLGSEDWHPIVGEYGMVKQFAGATCIHWTANNTTRQTRVSLDFRLVCQRFYSLIPPTDGKNDCHQITDSYYSVCEKLMTEDNVSIWKKRDDSTSLPDARMGFPWTIKNWDKFLIKKD